MSPVRVFPNVEDVFACCELDCQFLDGYTLESCEKERHCPFAFQRRREENALDQARKDAAAGGGDHLPGVYPDGPWRSQISQSAKLKSVSEEG